MRALMILLTQREPLGITVDGEPDVLETPIEFRIEPRALRVLVPPGA